MATPDKEIKIFKLNRIKFDELYKDATAYIKATYKAVGQKFNTASPFGQLLQVILHLGRMIFYYIEDSITGLNIRTAYRPDQVKGLAALAGHDTSRPIAARGAIKISYYDTGDTALNGNICYIANKTTVVNKLNGYTYTILMGADNGKITMQSGNYLEANLIQGEIKLQSATGTGTELQSYNFAERNYAEVDQYFVNIYVNGEPWEIVASLNDLGYNQKGCIVRTGINSGIDVFFGNGIMGAIPGNGSTIAAEYIVTDGDNANLTKDVVNSSNYWEIEGDGVMPDGSTVPLNDNFRITCLTDIIFGTQAEDTALTQVIAPHVSRSFVLANETNYKYFFKRMNMFSYIEIFRGSYTINGTSIMQLAYDQANDNYKDAYAKYQEAIDTYGESSDQAKSAFKNVEHYLTVRNYASTKLSDNTYRDNTIYIMLVPDISKRISPSQNYFNCDESLFYLSQDEQENIINLLNNSGQRIITIENRILQPKTPRFALNVQVKMWEQYTEQEIYAECLQKLSDYLIAFNRKDIIPISDIIALFENVNGIDSVKASFDTDINNQNIYGSGNYGLDKYGDIILTRRIVNSFGQYQDVKDILPVLRGGFMSVNGIEYSNVQTYDGLSAFNLTVTGKSSNKKVNLSKYTPLT